MTRVLVVDDEPQLLRALRINLRARGHEVEVAADGTTALRRAGSWPPDLVVLDLGLPDLDGIEVIHGLRGWTGVPIIVLSGRAGSHDKVEALEAGADDYVTKPFDIEELVARIRAVSAGCGDRAGHARRGGRAHRRPGREDGDGRSAADAHRMAAAGRPAPQPRQARRAAAVAHHRVGSRVQERDALPAPVHGPVAPQARKDPAHPGTC